MTENEFEASGKRILEAVLFAAGDPVRLDVLQRIFGRPALAIQNLAAELKQDLLQRKSGLTIRQVAGGFQMVTVPELFSYVEKLTQITDKKLSAPTMETLSIIAFKQPITKSEIESIRGVRVEKALQKLLDLELIEEQGRKQAVGRPILYGTSENFLKAFGLDSLDDLPELPSDEEAAEGLDIEQLTLMETEESEQNKDSHFHLPQEEDH
jgi:segregation and condensation protein B